VRVHAKTGDEEAVFLGLNKTSGRHCPRQDFHRLSAVWVVKGKGNGEQAYTISYQRGSDKWNRSSRRHGITALLPMPPLIGALEKKKDRDVGNGTRQEKLKPVGLKNVSCGRVAFLGKRAQPLWQSWGSRSPWGI